VRCLLEVCLVELCTLPSAADVGSLIVRLEALEVRLGGAPAPRVKPEARAAEAPPASRRAAESAARPTGQVQRAADLPPRSADPPPPVERAAAIEPAAPVERAAGIEPPPPVERAAAIEPAGEGDAVIRWRQAVDRVKERKLLLGTCLEEGLFLGIAGSNVRVALSPDHAFHRAMLEMKENREILNQEFERLYGRGATLICVSSDQAVTGAGYQIRAAESEAEPDEEGGSDGAADGLVQRIVDLFDGEILKPGPQGSGAS